MFGGKKKMVEKHEWDKINNKIDGMNTQDKIEIAAACASSKDEQAPEFLISLLNDPDLSVKLEAVKSLAPIGGEHAKTSLMWLSDHLPEGSDAIKTEIAKSIEQISNRRK